MMYGVAKSNDRCLNCFRYFAVCSEFLVYNVFLLSSFLLAFYFPSWFLLQHIWSTVYLAIPTGPLVRNANSEKGPYSLEMSVACRGWCVKGQRSFN
ncbi:hypothetical protein BC832DRAFT_349539 [Gaertneriomyces semiglobifer]|nr:hypothetical protein BC832DRAFT_349539 [Gaertneriomyces semiglobifer]